MLGWEMREDKRCPVIHCDCCGGLIEDVKEGAVHFDQVRVHVVHKTARCSQVSRGFGEWQNLGEFLSQLAHNLKIDWLPRGSES